MNGPVVAVGVYAVCTCIVAMDNDLFLNILSRDHTYLPFDRLVIDGRTLKVIFVKINEFLSFTVCKG